MHVVNCCQVIFKLISYKDAISYLKQTESLHTDFVDDEQEIILTATTDLKHRLKYVLPREVWPEDNIFVLMGRR